jgi:hypothetical protein
MDTGRFDHLTRALAVAPSRRGITRTFIGLAFGGAAALELIVDAEAKKCGVCKKKKKGKCKKKKPNDTACDGTGKCLNGTCNQPPDCLPGFAFACLDGNACCSGLCQGLFPTSQCSKGAKDTPCYNNVDCTSNVCIGFRCQ